MNMHNFVLLFALLAAVFGEINHVYRPGDIVSVRCPLICNYDEDTVGMIITSGLGQQYFQHDDNNTVLLYIQGVTQDMNGTEISCIARYPEGNCSSVFTLKVEGPPSAVSSLSVAVSENNTLNVNWTAPFTLRQNQNITYCVDLVNSTSNSILHSECGLVDTHYSTTGLALTCDPMEVVVTPVGEQGRGTESMAQLSPPAVSGNLSCDQNQDQCHCWLQIDEHSAPVCSASATVTGIQQEPEAEIVDQGKQVLLNFKITGAAETYEIQLCVFNSDRVPTTFNFTLNRVSSVDILDVESSTDSICRNQSVPYDQRTVVVCSAVFASVFFTVLLSVITVTLPLCFYYRKKKGSHNLENKDHNNGEDSINNRSSINLVAEETRLRHRGGGTTRGSPVDLHLSVDNNGVNPVPFLGPLPTNMESSFTTEGAFLATTLATDKSQPVSIEIDEETPETLDSPREEPPPPPPPPSPTECQSSEMAEQRQVVSLSPHHAAKKTYESKVVVIAN